jgi:NADPH:quinone reductase-like Zn-dependent oxidoreductase
MYKFRVIATCAPSNFDHLKSLGACYVLDYRDEDVVARIRKLAPDLEYAFDTLGPSSNSLIVSQALASGGGNLHPSLRRLKYARSCSSFKADLCIYMEGFLA